MKLFFFLLLISVSFAKETYVLIHSASTGAFEWYKIKQRLQDLGHTVIAIDLPSLGVDKTDKETVQLRDHVNAILKVLDSLPEPAIVVSHSYSGVVLSLLSETRPEKIKKAVYLCGFMLQNGESVVSANKRNRGTLIPIELVYGDFENIQFPEGLDEENIDKEGLCGDCSQDDISLMRLTNQFHPKATLFTPISIGAGFTSVNKVYISTLFDKALTPEFQRDMYSKFPETKVYFIESSHMVVFAKPDELVKILTNLA